MELNTTRSEKILVLVHTDHRADNRENGKIDVCEVSSTVAQTGSSISENAITLYVSLEIFDAQ